ncbi:hypothetical protein EXIGLDRAFT_582784, partial [Exidia glandulosa HHB12029]
CTVYDLLDASRHEVEVIKCESCPARFEQFAGPDLGSLGLYNSNNHRILTHRLLNGFSSSFTRIATPFSAYVEVRAREYSESRSPIPFMSVEVFMNCWFGFVRLQHNAHAFACALCGPDPKVIIADGISAGFDLKNVRASLRPPTVVDD